MPPSGGDKKQRWTASNPCPICGGYDRLPRGRGQRCAGFLSSDGRFAYCTREEHSGSALGYHPKAEAWYYPLDAKEEKKPARDRDRQGKFDRSYSYHSEDGELLFQVVRLKEPKGFYQRVPDQSKRTGWRNSIKGARIVPFRLPELIESDPEAFVWFAEGEKDALRLVDLGLVATTNPGGSSAWGQLERAELELAFRQRSVVLVVDHDQPSRKWARSLAEAIYPIAREVRILDLFALEEWPEGADVSDWIDRREGRTAAEIAGELAELAFECSPWTPQAGAIEAQEEEAAEWGPLELSDADRAVAPFPIDIFPLAIRDLCAEAARVMAMPIDFFAAAVLTAVAAAVGRSRAVGIKATWIEPPNLYLGLIGKPGQGKTPALKLISRPLFQIAHERIDAYKEAKKSAQEAAKRAAKAAKEKGKPRPETSAESEGPPERLLLSDITVEALAVRLQDNPRGLVIVKDELSGWMAGLNQYKGGGKGNDRQFFLSAWSGEAVSVDRKGQADSVPIWVLHPCLSLIGGIQPEVVRQQFAEQSADDGLIDRFLFVAPPPTPRYLSRDEIPLALMAHWGDTVRRLWSLQLITADNGDTRSKVLKLSEDASDLFFGWANERHYREADQDDFPARLQGIWTKLAAYCGRLALLVELLRHAAAFEGGDGPEVVSAPSMEAAIRLIDYFKSHARVVHGMIRGRNPDNPDAAAVVNWIRRGKRKRFTARDLKHDLAGRFRDDAALMAGALKWLEERNAVRPCPDEAQKTGRKSQAWDVHPLLG